MGGQPLFTLTELRLEDIEYLYSVGFRFFKAGQYNEALKFFTYLTMLHSLDGRFIMGAALCYLNLKHYSEAILNFLLLKKMFAETIDPHVNIHPAECFNALKIEEGTIASLKEAIRFYKKNHKYASNLKSTEELLATFEDKKTTESK